jgi:hypothetical protein
MSRKKENRNKDLVKKRDNNPELYSFRNLGGFFNISPSTAHEIYHREKGKIRKK